MCCKPPQRQLFSFSKWRNPTPILLLIHFLIYSKAIMGRTTTTWSSQLILILLLKQRIILDRLLVIHSIHFSSKIQMSLLLEHFFNKPTTIRHLWLVMLSKLRVRCISPIQTFYNFSKLSRLKLSRIKAAKQLRNREQPTKVYPNVYQARKISV